MRTERQKEFDEKVKKYLFSGDMNLYDTEFRINSFSNAVTYKFKKMVSPFFSLHVTLKKDGRIDYRVEAYLINIFTRKVKCQSGFILYNVTEDIAKKLKEKEEEKYFTRGLKILGMK